MRPRDGASARTLTGQALASFAIKVVGQGLVFLCAMTLTRILPLEQYGMYAIAMSVTLLLSIPFVHGIPVAVVRYTTLYRKRDDLSTLAGLLRTAHRFVLLSSVVLAAVAAVVITALESAGKIPALQARTALATLALLPLIGLLNLHAAFSRGLAHVLTGQVAQTILRPALFLLPLGLWLAGLLPLPPDPVVAVGVHFLAYAAAVATGVWLLGLHAPFALRRAAAGFDSRGWLGSAVRLSLVGGTFVLNQNADILMLGALAGSRDAGVYHALTRMANLGIFVMQAAGVVIMPTIGSQFAAGDTRAIQRTVTTASRLILAGSIPIVGVLLLVPGPLLSSFFGPGFSVGATALVILAIAQGFNALMGPTGIVLSMSGNERFMSAALGLSAVVNILLNAVLIPAYGITGAALATASSIVLWNVAFAWAALRRTGINCTAFARARREPS